MNRIAELIACSQSCWMDDLRRRMIKSGDLARRVADEGLRGITSNPTIFAKAVAGSPAAAAGSIAPVHRLGITQLPHSGKAAELLDRYGISRGAIQQRALQLAA